MPPRRSPRAVLGGTFDRLHAGHEALLAAAFDHAEEVGIGLTTDEFLRGPAGARKAGEVRPFEERRRELEAFLGARFPGRAYYLIPLTERWGAALEPGIRALVLSEETLPVGLLANRIRQRQHARPLTLVVVRAVLGEDLLRISSSRIRQGLIDRSGRRLVPVRVGVGSTNLVKRAGVESAFRGLFPHVPIQVEAVSPGGPNAQPWGPKEGFAGARRRAALARGGLRDYGVGVEATMLPLGPKEGLFDVHCLAVDGADGVTTVGLSAAYPVPPELEPALRAGRTLEEAVGGAGGPPRVGHTTGGALSFLTGGEVSREDVIAQGIRSAMVPRLSARAGRLPSVEVRVGGKVKVYPPGHGSRARR